MSLETKTENVMTKRFCRKLVTNSVESDAYPLSNLLDDSEKATHQSKGFMVAHFVKAPVLIRFEFEQSIRLVAIEIGLKVGAQKTTSLEIFFGSGGLDELMTKMAFIKIPTGKDFLLLKSANNRLAKEFSSSNPEKTFDFLLPNKRFADKKGNEIRSIGINVVQSVGVPCIKSIRVFVPSKMNSSDSMECKNSIESLDSAKKSSPVVKLNTSECKTTETPVESKTRGIPVERKRTPTESKTTEIPAEFFDAVTNEVMSLPVLLPSGKSVDRSTLEKYSAAESAHGRSPNDPFTLLPFTEIRKPLPHISLKNRIDAFFLLNQNLAKSENFGRTMCGNHFSIDHLI